MDSISFWSPDIMDPSPNSDGWFDPPSIMVPSFFHIFDSHGHSLGLYLAKSKNGENKVLTCTLPFWYEKGCARGVRCVRAGCACGACGLCVRGVRGVRAGCAYGARGVRVRCARFARTVRAGVVYSTHGVCIRCVRMSEHVQGARGTCAV